MQTTTTTTTTTTTANNNNEEEAEEEEVAARFADTLFLCPSSVRALVAYWLRAFVPLPLLGAPADAAAAAPTAPPVTARDAALATLHALVRRLLDARPCELQLCGQLATLPTPATRQPVPLFLWHVIPPGTDWSLVVPDHYVLHAAAPEVCRTLAACMATMASAPDAYWARVTGGGMRGPIKADTFRFGAALGRAYVPELFVAHVYAALLEALVARELTPAGVVLHGPAVVRALAQPLCERPSAHCGPVLAELGARLAACTDADAARRQTQQLAANLDHLAQAEYERRRH